MRMSITFRRAAIVACVAVVTAACSSTTTPSSQKSTGGSGSFKLTSPLKLIGLWQLPGENPIETYDHQYGAELAVSQINKAGGVGGLPVQFERVPTNPQDASQANTAVRTALGDDPSVLLGPDVSVAALAGAPLACQAHVPMLSGGPR